MTTTSDARKRLAEKHADGTAPKPAPVAVPEGGWRDGDQIAVLHGPDLRVLDREGERWAWSDNGNEVSDRPEYFAYNDSIVYVHAPREDARPEPVAAPLPTGAVEAGLEASRETPTQVASTSPETWMRNILTAALPHLDRLVPADDEDTVRVPMEAGGEDVETYSVAQIRDVFQRHASQDTWGVESFYENGIIAALRGEYDGADQ